MEWVGKTRILRKKFMVEKKEKIRIQFDFSQKQLEVLESLVEKTDSTSKAEVERKSIRVYNMLVNKALQGFSFQFIDPKTKEVMLSFDNEAFCLLLGMGAEREENE